ncbi:MAG: cytochrome b5 domain-containing protein [Patescibacteria group bacterium]|jgi:cytochrome b involved in lipid metabolism|nr:cytochrome b5 domain-containing protein [Patescibacteria group bacterium]
MKRVYVIIIAIALIGMLLAGVYLLFLSNDNPTSTEQTKTSEIANSNDQSGSTAEAVKVTNEELSTKNTASECWTVINGKVYDLTEYIPRHPGGDEVLLACGTDGTTLFVSRKTETGESVGSGTPHSSSATSQLEQYYIGDLSN